MRKLILVSLVLASVTVLFSGCNPYKKMQKNVQTIEAQTTPEVLVLTGNTVNADIAVTFPEKYFGKDIILRLTPVLVFEGGEIVGTPEYFQGEKVRDNYTVVPHKAGGTYIFSISLPYDHRAVLSTLELHVCGRYADKKKEALREFAPFGTLEVAQGVSIVQSLATPYLSIMPHGFQRITNINKEAEIHYLVSSSTVRNAQLSQEQVKLFEDFVRDCMSKENVTLGTIHAKGYASPEGPVNFNDKLSAARSKSGEKALQRQLKGVDVNYDAAAYGEDWEGFRKLVEASDIADKHLILSVISQYESPVEREREIKNLSTVYKELKETVLPALRRTHFTASADVLGYSDEELLVLISEDHHRLKIEEMLYAATLLKGHERIAAYRLAAERFNDQRAHNNLAVALFESGDIAGAKTAIHNASSLGNHDCVTNNLAAIAIIEGDYDTAKRLLATSNCPNAAKNKALVALHERDYATASRGLEGHNLAVAEVLNGNYDKAKSILHKEERADSLYLKAVIAMREGDSHSAISHLKNAIAKDAKLRERAFKDIEFARLFGTEEFLRL